MIFKEYNNFLSQDFFEKLKDVIMDQDFPWRRRDHMTDDSKDKMFFTPCF